MKTKDRNEREDQSEKRREIKAKEGLKSKWKKGEDRKGRSK